MTNVDSSTFNVLSICAGYGGLDLGVRLAVPRARTVCYVEREAYTCAQLVARIEEGFMDDAPLWTDARTFDGRPWRGRVHCVIAGYPCQPFSEAGKRLGSGDPRHLWPFIAEHIRSIKPPFVFLENVANHLRLGFADVRSELRGMGYRVEAGLFAAAEVGASHIRKRLFALAFNERFAGEGRQSVHARSGAQGRGEADSDGAGPDVADAELSERWPVNECGRRCAEGRDGERQTPSRIGERGEVLGHAEGDHGRREQQTGREGSGRAGFAGTGRAFPPGPADLDEWQRILESDPSLEPALRRVPDGRASRVDELRELGNGVVPVVAAYAFATLAALFDE